MRSMRRHVAVVDDDESVRESLPDLLRQYGYAAVAFASAEEFLTLVRLEDIDCLILDIAMPGMSGPELQRELARRGEKVPVIFITGHADTGVRSTLRKEGAVDVLIKPFSADDLLSALRVALPPG
jgi:FixJ family two-component response regulator